MFEALAGPYLVRNRAQQLQRNLCRIQVAFSVEGRQGRRIRRDTQYFPRMRAGIASLLQEQADDLRRDLPNLCPTFLPATALHDIFHLAELEGDSGCQALLEVIAAAGEGAEGCEICGEPGEFAIDPDMQQNETTLLRTTLDFRVCCQEKILVPTKCVDSKLIEDVQFACGLCRQLRTTSSLIHEILNFRPDGDRATAEGLMEHLALVNGHTDIASKAPSLMTWGEGLLSRIYALKVCLSAEQGWALGNPDGSMYSAGKPGSAAEIALELLLPNLTPEERQNAVTASLSRNHSIE